MFEGDQVKYGPAIAESWKILDDKTYEFKIRKGVKFQNGETVTAQDVAFSLNRILDKDNKLAALTYFQYFSEAKVIDDNTVVITTKEPHAPAIPRLTFLTIVPEKYVREVGNDAFSIKPIGAGPYKLVEWVKGESVTLEAHKDYYLGAPKIAKVIFRNVKEPATKIAMLQSGEADVIDNVPPANVSTLQASPDLEVKIERTVADVVLRDERAQGRSEPVPRHPGAPGAQLRDRLGHHRQERAAWPSVPHSERGGRCGTGASIPTCHCGRTTSRRRSSSWPKLATRTASRRPLMARLAGCCSTRK